MHLNERSPHRRDGRVCILRARSNNRDGHPNPIRATERAAWSRHTLTKPLGRQAKKKGIKLEKPIEYL
jgi:hypothetical protein